MSSEATGSPDGGMAFCSQQRNARWQGSLNNAACWRRKDLRSGGAQSHRKAKPSSGFTYFSYRLHGFICKSLGFLGDFLSFIGVILDVSISIESKCGIEREVLGFSEDSVGMGKVNTPLNLLSALSRTQYPPLSNPNLPYFYGSSLESSATPQISRLLASGV